MALRANPPRKRRYLPFDGSWGMRVALPVSQAVVVGGNAWTCGQCDLDPGGGTRHAGDRLAQTGPVMTHLMRVLTTAGVLPGAPLHIHAFYVDDDTIDESAWAAQLMEQLPPDTAAALYLTPLAALGYPGMVTEIDAVASVTPTSDTGGETGGQSGAVDACRVGDLVYSAGLDAGIGAPAVAAATLLGRLEQAFRSAGASIADVVKLNLLHEAALDTQDLTAIETTLAAGLVAAGCRVPPVFSIVPLARLPAAGGWRLQGIALTGAAAAAPRRSLTAGDVDWRRSGAGAWSEALVAERRVFVGMQLPVDAAEPASAALTADERADPAGDGPPLGAARAVRCVRAAAGQDEHLVRRRCGSRGSALEPVRARRVFPQARLSLHRCSRTRIVSRRGPADGRRHRRPG